MVFLFPPEENVYFFPNIDKEICATLIKPASVNMALKQYLLLLDNNSAIPTIVVSNSNYHEHVINQMELPTASSLDFIE